MVDRTAHATINVEADLAPMQCWKCGICFAVPAHWKCRREEDGATVWCPNGHKGALARPAADPDLERRQELVAALHRAEQAEAAAAEAKSARGVVNG